MTSTLFIAFVAFMVLVVIALLMRLPDRRVGVGLTAALIVWLAYVGLISHAGLVANTTMRPPGAAFLFLPVVAFLVVLAWWLRGVAGARLAMSIPLWILLAVQCFRVIVELFLHQLWHDGLIPRMLTYSGANLDIYVGASAPLIAWLIARGQDPTRLRIALIWNVLGVIILLNVVARAILTAPGPANFIHAEIPNRMIGTFPYTFIPGFFVPLAMTLHFVAIRAIVSKPRQDQSVVSR